MNLHHYSPLSVVYNNSKMITLSLGVVFGFSLELVQSLELSNFALFVIFLKISKTFYHKEQLSEHQSVSFLKNRLCLLCQKGVTTFIPNQKKSSTHLLYQPRLFRETEPIRAGLWGRRENYKELAPRTMEAGRATNVQSEQR